MSSVLRVIPPVRRAMAAAEDSGNEQLKAYFERLYKLIPGEIMGLYTVGAGVIPKEYPWMLVGWFIFSILALILIRRRATADPEAGLGPQNPAVMISLVSFVIWVYTLGGPFEVVPYHDLHVPFIGSLLVLAWTFVVPYFYQGQSKPTRA